jgi:hypothetical protein
MCLGSATNNNGFWIAWLDLLALLLQLQSIITAHNRWLPKTRSIPYWTTSIFSSTVTDLVLIYEMVTSSTTVVCWLTLHSWTLNSLMNESELTLLYNSGWNEERPPPWTVRLLLFVSSVATKHANLRTMLWFLPVYPLLRNAILASRCLAMDYSITICCPVIKHVFSSTLVIFFN